MKKYIFKKGFNLILLGSLILGTISPVAFASNQEEIINDNQVVEVTEEDVSKLGEDLVHMIKPNQNIIVSAVVKMYDSQEKAIGYMISFKKEDIKFGYAIYDFRIPGYLTEFSIDENVGDYLDQSVEIANQNNIEVNEEVSKKDTKIIEVEPLNFTVQVNDDVVITSNNEILTNQENTILEETSNDIEPLTEEFITEDNLAATSKYDSDDKILLKETARGLTNVRFNMWRQFIPSVESQVEAQTGIWACAVTALDILTKSTNLEQNTKVSYPNLWNYSSTKHYKTTNGIKYGSTQNGNIGNGLTKFANLKGKKITHQNYTTPNFSIFKSAIDNKQPAIFSYGYTPKGQSRIGHSVAVEGYMTSNQANYLVVADGWYESAKYINYIPANFTDTYGIVWSGIKTL